MHTFGNGRPRSAYSLLSCNSGRQHVPIIIKLTIIVRYARHDDDDPSPQRKCRRPQRRIETRCRVARAYRLNSRRKDASRWRNEIYIRGRRGTRNLAFKLPGFPYSVDSHSMYDTQVHDVIGKMICHAGCDKSSHLSETHVALDTIQLILLGHRARVHVGQKRRGTSDDNRVGQQRQRQANIREHVLGIVLRLCTVNCQGTDVVVSGEDVGRQKSCGD